MLFSLTRPAVAFLILGFLLALSESACDRPKAESGKVGTGGKPKLVVIGGDTVDWGKTGPGVLTHSIKVTNVGGDTLKIADVHPSCGCTTAPLDKKVLLSGDTATIDVKVDVPAASGDVNKHLTITSNDSTRPSFDVVLHAFIERDLAAVPSFFPAIGIVEPGKEWTTSVELKNTGDDPITIQPPTIVDPAAMTVHFDFTTPQVIQPHDSLKLVAHAIPVAEGSSSTNVLIRSSSKKVPELHLNLTVNAAKKQ
jgi:hypothetical protein